jgi:hypothetical protein
MPSTLQQSLLVRGAKGDANTGNEDEHYATVANRRMGALRRRRPPCLSLATIPSGFEIDNIEVRATISSAITLPPMFDLFYVWFGLAIRLFRNRQNLLLENRALRQQLVVLKGKHPKPTLRLVDKLFGSPFANFGLTGKSRYSPLCQKQLSAGTALDSNGIGSAFLAHGAFGLCVSTSHTRISASVTLELRPPA